MEILVTTRAQALRTATLAAASLSLGILGCGWSDGNREDRPLWTMQRAPLRVTVREAGSLEALKSETISSQVEGQSAIVEVVPEGTVLTAEDVKQGRVLVKLDAKDLNEKLVRQQIDVRAAHAATENALSALDIQRHQNSSDVREAELGLRFALLDLRRYVGDLLAGELLAEYAPEAATPAPSRDAPPTNGAGTPEEGGAVAVPAPAATDPAALHREIEAALTSPELAGEALQKRRELESDIKLAQEELQRAEEKLKWTVRLLEKAFVSAEEREADRLAVERHRVALEKARTARLQYVGYDFPKEVEKLLSGVVQARDKLERTIAQAKSEEAKDQAELASKKEQERLQRDRLTAYEAQLERTVIRARKTGMVVYASSGSDRGRYSGDAPIQQGTLVRENQPLLTIPDADSLGAVVNIHESAIEKVEKGQRVSVVVDAVPDLAIQGVVEKKARLPNPTDRWLNPDLKVYATQIRLLGAYPTLQPGMSVRVEIEVTTLAEVLVVPLQAVAGRAGAPALWVLEGDATVERPVVLGLSNDAFAEVKEGVREGERVLLAPPRGTQATEKGPGAEAPVAPVAPGGMGGTRAPDAAPSAPAPEGTPPATEGAPPRERPPGAGPGGGRSGGGGRSREGRGGGGPPPGR